MAGLSRSDVEHVAFLARLGMSSAELDRLQGQLNQILDQYAKLAELDTDAIPPTAQTIELENILRDDVVKPSLSQAAALAKARADAVAALARAEDDWLAASAEYESASA